MHRSTGTVLLTLLTLALWLGFLTPGAAGADIPGEEKAKIDAALPRQPIVNPRTERRLLVFTLSKGFKHSAIPYGEYTFKRLGETSGAYTATVSEDPRVFAPDSLARYDAILFNNTTGTLFEDPVLRESLMNFVRGGGGIAGIHAATDCFYDWPAFGEMMGGYFDGHPWNESVTLKIEEPNHPVAQPLGEEFVVADEIYQFKEPYSRENLRVLVSLDTDKTNMNKNGIRRDDGDFAVSWVRDYGEGRVFYCSLGHRHDIFWNEPVLEHYLAGIQFALGDLEADARPSAARSGDMGMAGDLEDAFAAARDYQFGDSRVPLRTIETAVYAAADDPARGAALEAKLIDLLQGDVSDEVKSFALRQLSVVGGEAGAEAAAPLLTSERLSHMARYALERLNTPAADEILLEALGELEGDLRIGVVNSIGQRGDRSAIEPLLELALAEETDDKTRAAIAGAIGRLGGMEGNDALVDLANLGRREQSDVLLDAVHLAMARCAAALVEDGESEQAAKIYTRLHNPGMEERHRLAGLRGLAITEPLKTVPKLIKNITGEEGVMRQTSLRLVRAMPGGSTVTRVFAIQLADLPFRAQADLIEALGDRGDRGALRVISKRVDSGNRGVTRAAIRALAKLGDAKTVPQLATLMANGSQEARESLMRLRGEGVNEAIVDAMGDFDSAARVQLIEILGERQATAAVDDLLDVAGSDESQVVRLAAYDVVEQLGGAGQAQRCLDLLLAAPTDAEREAAADALIACCERSDDREACVAPVADALAPAEAGQPQLLRVLSRVGGETALKSVRRFYATSDGARADAALLALAGWRDAAPAEELLSIVTSGRPEHRRVAFEGYINVVSLPSDRPASEDVRMYQRLLVQAQTPRETRLVLEALADVPHPAVLDVAEGYLDDTQQRWTAIETIIDVAVAISGDHERRALAAVEKALEYAPDDEQLRRRIGEAVDAIEADRGFVTSFLYAGPYTKAGAGAEEVFETSFEPESEGFTGWSALPAGAVSPPGRIDLNAIEPTNNAAIYLWANVTADERQQVRFQCGSDDGIRVWLNGEMIHSNMVYRGVTLNEDEVMATLRPGTNRLLIKVVQGSGGWGVACRLRSPEGFALENVEVRHAW